MADEQALIVVQTTVDSEQAAEKLAEALLDQRLAACVQIGAPVTSLYRWKGKLERAKEWPLLIKTLASRHAQLERALARLHPYEVPEHLVFNVDHASPDYARWVVQETLCD
ncbi:MAG: divalent-cation tolerance protein CutA [Pigmentiphaga sp.]|nr:divalent-cation tolerance protein CutA [Pigmentiphaga sp.]